MPNLLPPELREEQEAVNSLHTGSDAAMEGLVDALEQVAAKYAGWDNAVKLLELWEQAHKARGSNTAPGLAVNIPSPDKGAETKFGASLRLAGLEEAPLQWPVVLVPVALGLVNLVNLVNLYPKHEVKHSENHKPIESQRRLTRLTRLTPTRQHGGSNDGRTETAPSL